MFAGIFMRSLFYNYGLWVSFCSVLYLALFVSFRDFFAPWKFNKDYPKTSILLKELRRSSVAVLVCSGYDSALKGAIELGWIARGSGAYPESVAELFNTLWLNRGVLVLLIFWADAHFYVYHRFAHDNRWYYKNIHKTHHESRNVNPFSSISFHPIESLSYFSSLLIGLMVPLDPLVHDLFRTMLLLSPLIGHCGHGSPSWPWGYDHWIHHHYFNYNLASGVLPCGGIWDNLFGTAYKEGSKCTIRREKAAQEQATMAGQMYGCSHGPEQEPALSKRQD